MKLVYRTVKEPISIGLSLKDLIAILNDNRTCVTMQDTKNGGKYMLEFPEDNVSIKGDLVWITPDEDNRDATFHEDKR